MSTLAAGFRPGDHFSLQTQLKSIKTRLRFKLNVKNFEPEPGGGYELLFYVLTVEARLHCTEFADRLSGPTYP